MKTVVGVFDDFAQAKNAAHDLENAGISHEDISIMSGGASAQTVREATTTTETTDTTFDTPAAETGKGVVTGGVLGLIAGLVSLAIPGVGTVIGAGWLWLILVGAVAGGVVGLVGALVAAGVPHEQAVIYNEAVKRGGTLIAVRAADAMADRVAQIMTNDGAVNIDERAAQYRQEGWMPDRTAAANPNMPPVVTTPTPMTTSTTAPAGQWSSSTTTSPAAQTTTGANMGTTYGEHVGRSTDFDTFDQDFRSDWRSNYGNMGGNYEQYEPAYRYGWDMANDARYRGRDWNTVAPEFQRDWETRYPGTWNQFQNSVRYGWDKMTGSERGGIKTGGYHTDDGTPDQRGIMEKMADTVTGDRIDDKTGKPV